VVLFHFISKNFKREILGLTIISLLTFTTLVSGSIDVKKSSHLYANKGNVIKVGSGSFTYSNEDSIFMRFSEVLQNSIGNVPRYDISLSRRIDSLLRDFNRHFTTSVVYKVNSGRNFPDFQLDFNKVSYCLYYEKFLNMENYFGIMKRCSLANAERKFLENNYEDAIKLSVEYQLKKLSTPNAVNLPESEKKLIFLQRNYKFLIFSQVGVNKIEILEPKSKKRVAWIDSQNNTLNWLAIF